MNLKTTFMTELNVTDSLVAEGSAGQTAALAASEEGFDLVLLGDRRPPGTAVSTGFLTFAASSIDCPRSPAALHLEKRERREAVSIT
jgi:hypothetical protein